MKRKGTSLRPHCGADNAHIRGGSRGYAPSPVHSEGRRGLIGPPYASCVSDRAVTKNFGNENEHRKLVKEKERGLIF